MIGVASRTKTTNEVPSNSIRARFFVRLDGDGGSIRRPWSCRAAWEVLENSSQMSRPCFRASSISKRPSSLLVSTRRSSTCASRAQAVRRPAVGELDTETNAAFGNHPSKPRQGLERGKPMWFFRVNGAKWWRPEVDLTLFPFTQPKARGDDHN